MIVDADDDDGYLAGMSDEDIARFRAHAEQCQIQADRAVRPEDQEAWLRMAAEWIKLALDAERRRGRK
jgi:hypothetical protein